MENILIDTDIAIEYLRSKDKGSTELVRLLRNHVIHVYRENTSPRNGRPLLSRRNGERKKLIFSKRLSCLGQFWQVAVFL